MNSTNTNNEAIKSLRHIFNDLESHTKWDKFINKLYALKWKIVYAYQKHYYRYFGNKHHLIDTKLEPRAWYDCDYRMLYGMMSLLMDYVNNDINITDWGWNQEFKDAHREIMAIKTWWENYPKRQNEIEAAIDKWWNHCKEENEKLYSTEEDKRLLNETSIMEKKLEDETQEMLMRLVKIRYYLST